GRGNGFGARERVGGALAGRGVVGPEVARSEGHTTWSMRHKHTRPTSSSWEKSGSGIMVLPPHTDGEMGLSYPIFRLPNYHWVGSGRVTLRHVSPIPPLDPYVRLSPHTAHERGTFTGNFHFANSTERSP